jgi:hypothetical protein
MPKEANRPGEVAIFAKLGQEIVLNRLCEAEFVADALVIREHRGSIRVA